MNFFPSHPLLNSEIWEVPTDAVISTMVRWNTIHQFKDMTPSFSGRLRCISQVRTLLKFSLGKRVVSRSTSCLPEPIAQQQEVSPPPPTCYSLGAAPREESIFRNFITIQEASVMPLLEDFSFKEEDAQNQIQGKSADLHLQKNKCVGRYSTAESALLEQRRSARTNMPCLPEMVDLWHPHCLRKNSIVSIEHSYVLCPWLCNPGFIFSFWTWLWTIFDICLYNLLYVPDWNYRWK